MMSLKKYFLSLLTAQKVFPLSTIGRYPVQRHKLPEEEIDVFSVNNEDPVRIEFFGDEIDSIRFFDLDTQRTIKQVNEVRIISATDLLCAPTSAEPKNERLRNSEPFLSQKILHFRHLGVIIICGKK